ncbi:MAG TPA: hypothetical protein VFS00_31825, partial [Polyangiaceae bacterium]|nr:hypothetical protein [Polyangiaceae bacterium]
MIEAAEAALAPPELASPSKAPPATRAPSPEASRPSADAGPASFGEGPSSEPSASGPGSAPSLSGSAQSTPGLAPATRRPGRARSPALAALGAAIALSAGVLGALRLGGPGRAPAGGPALAAAPLAPGRPAESKPLALTSLGGCSYSPAFADGATIAFDVTLGAENHLWTMPAAGGPPTQRTRGELTEWRAMPGRRPGEIVHLVSNPFATAGVGIAALDLATGASEMLSAQNATTALFAGGVLHYLRRDGAELRRVRDQVDESVLTFPPDVRAKVMGGAHDGRRVALAVPGKGRLCTIELAERRLACLETPRVLNARPAFSADDESIYYFGAAGVRRTRAAGGGDELVVPGANAAGGLAVSPDGARLVYSDCHGRGPLLDTSEAPPRPLSPTDDGVSEPGAGPGGLVAYAASTPEGSSLMLRRPDGMTVQLAGPFASRVTQPRFSRDGKHIAYSVGAEGLYVLN